MDRLPFLKNLNGLRFFAASYVIGFHFFSFPGFHNLTQFFRHGHIAVPFFFLLSGFILYYNYYSHEFKYIHYWKSRFIRLAPIYYMAMFCALPMLYIQQQSQSYTLVQNIMYALSNLSLTQALFINHDILSYWNLHSWSLSVEMFLYLCSPFIISGVRKLNIYKLLIVQLLMITINFFIFIDHLTNPLLNTILKNHFAPIYLFTFINGCVLASIFIKSSDTIKKRSPFLFVASFLGLSTLFLININKDFYSTFNPIFQILFSVLILGSCHQNNLNKWLGLPLLLILGEASYAMYIFQAPVKLATQQFLYKVIKYQVNTGFIYCFIIFIMITLVSVIVSKYIDPSIRKKMRKKFL